MTSPACQPLTRWDKILVTALLALLVGFGAMVEYRSAFLSRRMGDLDVFLRAAWAVRSGEDLYHVTSENDWHYLYPPLYAILLVPLADPPLGHEAAGYLVYSWSVAICYLLNVLGLFAGVHVLASALEASSADAAFRGQPRFCRRWWALRLLPIVVCLLPIGHTLMRGQVNLVVLGLLCAALAGWVRGRNCRAGFWLALAICIKVIPAYLLVYPLWRRDGRALLGCTAGLGVGLLAVPLLAFGPEKTVRHYETYGQVFFAPFFGINKDKSLSEEILGSVNATKSLGVRNALHNWLHPDRFARPNDFTLDGKIVYIVLGVCLTFLTLWPARRAQQKTTSGRAPAHPFAALIVLMMIFSPVCHPHYLMFSLPIVMSLLAAHWQFRPTLHVSGLMLGAFVLFFAALAVTYPEDSYPDALAALRHLMDRCAPLFATLPLWAIPVWQLWFGTPAPGAAPAQQTRLAA